MVSAARYGGPWSEGSRGDGLGLVLTPAAGLCHSCSGRSRHRAHPLTPAAFRPVTPDVASSPPRHVPPCTAALMPLTQLGAQPTSVNGWTDGRADTQVEKDMAGCCRGLSVCGGGACTYL